MSPDDGRLWRFQCPECGFGHTELGALAGPQELYCEICLSDDCRYVRLRRWIAVEEPMQGSGRPR